MCWYLRSSDVSCFSLLKIPDPLFSALFSSVWGTFFSSSVLVLFTHSVLFCPPFSKENPSFRSLLWSLPWIPSPALRCLLYSNSNHLFLNARTCAQVLSRVQLFEAPWTTGAHGAPVHGILQAKILEWVAMPSSRASSRSRDPYCVSKVSCIGRQALYH